jgi:hypothetical protein
MSVPLARASHSIAQMAHSTQSSHDVLQRNCGVRSFHTEHHTALMNVPLARASHSIAQHSRMSLWH